MVWLRSRADRFITWWAGLLMIEVYYEVDPEQEKTLKILERFSSLAVDQHPIFQKFKPPEEYTWEYEHKKYEDTNLWLMWGEINMFEGFDYDQSHYKRAMINILKLRLLLYATSCYFRSRIGYDLWFFKNRTNPNAYLPLTWEDIYEPDRWYQPGEPIRDEPVQRVWPGFRNSPLYKLPPKYNIRHLPKR